MPIEMIKEFIGKQCYISAMSGCISGRIIAVEDGWLRVEEKKKIRMVNLDYIRDICMQKEG